MSGTPTTVVSTTHSSATVYEAIQSVLRRRFLEALRAGATTLELYGFGGNS